MLQAWSKHGSSISADSEPSGYQMHALMRFLITHSSFAQCLKNLDILKKFSRRVLMMRHNENVGQARYEDFSGDLERSIAGRDFARGGEPDGDEVAAEGSSSDARALSIALVSPTLVGEHRVTPYLKAFLLDVSPSSFFWESLTAGGVPVRLLASLRVPPGPRFLRPLLVRPALSRLLGPKDG